MDFLTILFSPLNLLFFIIVIGLTIGKIQVKGISIGIAGVLFASMLVGFLLKCFVQEGNAEIITNAQSTLKNFSKLGTSLFVSVIGLQTGLSLKNSSKCSIISFAIGALMNISGIMVMLIISRLDKAISYSSLLGVLCGALTSTPGLSSVCELVHSEAENATLGYGGSYLLGVIFVVLFVQLCAPKNTLNNALGNAKSIEKSTPGPELILIFATALLGNIWGNMKFTLPTIAFGTTANTLMVGFVLGYIFCKKKKQNTISSLSLNTCRNLGLALFFAGTGFATGIVSVPFDIKVVLYGMLITLIVILCGSALCKLAVKKYPIHQEFIIAGGMTSSPAYGTLVNNITESTTNCFSFSYFGALITLITIIQIISR